MLALEEVEGNPFHAEDARGRMERDVGPLEGEIMRRRKGTTTTTTTTMMGSGGGSRNVLFGNRGGGGLSSYAPRPLGTTPMDVELGCSLTFAILDSRMEESALQDAGIMHQIGTDWEYNARNHGTAEGTD